MVKAFKYRLYPTDKQAQLIDKHIGSCRFIYNLALEVKNYAYTTQRKNLSSIDLINQLPELKKQCEWLNEIDSQALQQSVINLDKAFTRFFKGHASFPKFKNKQTTQSFRNPHGKRVKIENNKICQPKFQEGISAVLDREIVGQIRSTTISKTPTNKYFISVLIETNNPLPIKRKVSEKTTIGIDLGVKDFVVTSKGTKVVNPKHLQRSILHLKYLARQYSKKKKGSCNRKKSQLKLALCHEKITNQRKDFLHKLSSELIKNHDTLCFETLQIENMVKNHKLAQSIQSSSWGIFIEMCKYKAEWNGKNILQIPTFQPSTKICSTCGQANHTLTLADREWICANCNTLHDRDINAAINIKNYSLKNAAGFVVKKPVELPALAGTLKQEVISIKYDNTILNYYGF